MNLKIITSESNNIRNYLMAGAIVGVLFAFLEYIVKIKVGDEPELLIPLIIRAAITGMLIMGSVAIFEILFKARFRKKRFFYLVLVRSVFYTVLIIFWLFVVNGIWFAIHEEVPFYVELINYMYDEMFVINITSVFLVIIIGIGLGQINSLHRKGELLKFVLGKYHTPREVELVFCFIDLKGSTTIAEKLGHLKFAMFLKDYYSDITEALRKTNAQIYQYVGDEITLSWTYKSGLKNNNMINCFFEMKQVINVLKPKYIKKYGVFPEFKAGLHGGHVIVTWVGEMKKEIVYVGDVMNTTARIQEDCKRLAKDFLISESLLNRIDDLENIKATFVEDTVLRGKKEHVKLFSLEQVG